MVYIYINSCIINIRNDPLGPGLYIFGGSSPVDSINNIIISIAIVVIFIRTWKMQADIIEILSTKGLLRITGLDLLAICSSHTGFDAITDYLRATADPGSGL
jgi:hypothetical protein